MFSEAAVPGGSIDRSFGGMAPAKACDGGFVEESGGWGSSTISTFGIDKKSQIYDLRSTVQQLLVDAHLWGLIGFRFAR